jgi:hypothetical protein
MVEPSRHCLQDLGWWEGCGNNPTYDRINSTDPFPSQCAGSSSQYHCTYQCCVPTWHPVGDSFAWFPNTSSYFPDGGVDATPGPFATQRSDGTVYFPPNFPATARMPYQLFNATLAAPLALYADGSVNPLKRKTPATNCKYGVNEKTGYCLLTDNNLNYTEQLATLPGNSCDCYCIEDENWQHLSAVGSITTIVCTYLGFALLSVAVGWNANILKKLRRIPQQWRALRSGR